MRGFKHTVFPCFSAITTTTVTVELAAAPTADPVAADFQVLVNGNAVTASAVTKIASDLTGKTYRLTIPTLNNNEGTLTVNGKAPAAKVVAASEYDFDYKAPSITSVAAINGNQVKVNFSECMDATTATAAANYTLYTLGSPGPGGTEYVNTGGGSAVLSGDKKSVIITTGTPLIAAQYTLKTATAAILDIQNSATYAIPVGTEAYLTVTAGQLTDVTGPVLQTATYNNGTGILELKFDEAIDMGAGKYDLTKISLGGVALTVSDAIALKAGTPTTYTITLSAASKTAVNAVTDALTVSLAAGAVKDTATAGNANLAVADFAVTKTTPPIATSATYDEATNKLTINFDQVVSYKTADVDFTKITFVVNGATTVLTAQGTVKSTANTAALELELNAANAATIEGTAGTVTSGVLKLADGTVKNAAGTANLAANNNNIALTYTQDTDAPTITGVSYNTATNKLVISFSKDVVMNDATIDETKIELQDNVRAAIAMNEAYYTTATLTGKTLELAIDNVAANIEEAMENDGTVYAGGDFDLSKLKLVVKAGHAIADPQGNKLADLATYDKGVAVTYQDFNSPKVNTTPNVGAVAINSNTVDVLFIDEKGLTLDNTTATTAANYTVALSNGSGAIAVSTATMQPNNRTVRLKLASAFPFAGAEYKVTVANVKDAAGNLIQSATNSCLFTSSTTTDTVAPTVTGVVGTAVAGRNNDTIAITFSEDVDAIAATTLSNYVVEAPVGTFLTLNDANATIAYTPNVATITLKGINLQTATGVKVTVGPGLVDKAGNAIKSTANSGTHSPITDDSVAPTFASVSGSAGATENTITIVFSEELKAATAATATNYVFESPTGTVITTAPTSLTYNVNDKGTATAADDVASLVVKFPAGTLAAGSTVTVKAAAGNTLTDLCGLAVAAPGTTGAVADGVAPTVTVVSGTVFDPTGGKVNSKVLVTFSENVDATSAKTLANYVMKFNGVEIDKSKMKDANIAYDAATFTATITLDTDGTAGAGLTDFMLKKGTGNLSVTVSNVKDLAQNVMTSSTTVGNVVNTTTDGTAPDTASAGNGTAYSLTVTFSEELDPATVSAEDFKLTVGGVQQAITGVNLDATLKVVTINTNAPISDVAYTGNTVKVDGTTTTSIADLAGNVQTTLTQQTVAVATAGTLAVAQQAALADTSIGAGQTAQVLSDLNKLTVANEQVRLSSVEFTKAGTIDSANIKNLKLMYSSNATIGDADDVEIGTVADPATGATAVTFSNLSKVCTADANNFIYLKGDIASAAADAETFTFSIAAGDITFSGIDTGFLNLASTGTNAGTQATVDKTAPTIASATFTNATTLTIVFSEAVNAVASDFTNGATNAPGAFTIDSIAGSGTATIILTITGTPAVATGNTGTVDIAATVKDLNDQAFAGVVGQAITAF